MDPSSDSWSRGCVRSARGASHQPLRSFNPVSSSRYKVRITKDYLVFCSGHFITYEGDRCERIHGHNYRTAVEVEGDLDANHYVVDFIALKDMTRAITDELDHRMLLPTRNHLIRLHEDGPNMRVTYRDRFWSFPRDECVLLADRQYHRRAAGGSHRRAIAPGDGEPRLGNAQGLAGRGGREFRSIGGSRVACGFTLRGMRSAADRCGRRAARSRSEPPRRPGRAGQGPRRCPRFRPPR